MFNKLSQVFVKEKIWNNKSFYHNFAIIVIWQIVIGKKKKKRKKICIKVINNQL